MVGEARVRLVGGGSAWTWWAIGCVGALGQGAGGIQSAASNECNAYLEHSRSTVEEACMYKHSPVNGEV
eukprot:37788-Eustigmatos_ZCMA.PRE.1